jgi:hypothetical protein
MIREKLLCMFYFLPKRSSSGECPRVLSVALAMFKVTLQCGQTVAEVRVPNKQTELRDLQQDICRAFHVSFPSLTATLKVGDKIYDEFVQAPFTAGPPDQGCTVAFVGTRDMYWIDYLFRDRKGPSLEQEMNTHEPLPAPAIPVFPRVI